MSSPRPTRANIIPISRYAAVSTARPEDADAPMPTASHEPDAPTPEWEKHFFMAPNVRFTRTPDRPATRPGDEQAAAPEADASIDLTPANTQPAPAPVDAPAAQQPVAKSIAAGGNWDVIALSSLLAEALDEPVSRAEPAPVSQIPVGPIAYLSDHAFFDLGIVPNDDAPIKSPVARPAASTVPAKHSVVATPAPAPTTTDDVSNLYRVIDCGTGATPTSREAATPVIQVAVPVATPEPARPARAVMAPVHRPTMPSLPASAAMTTTASIDGYELPSPDLLQLPPSGQGFYMTQERLEQNADLLESVLEDFGVKGEIIHVRPGPVVTLYEFEPAPGVKSSRVINLADDIARSMSSVSARVAVIPGRNVIGIELPNEERETVYFRDMIESDEFGRSMAKLALCLGKDIGGEPIIADLARMPHLLVAGTTGSGKSVAINTMILSLLYRLKPEECRLIMVDPKMLELSVYDGIPHLLTPVVTDPHKAVTALKWAVREMEDRYRKMARLGVRNIDGYNSRAASAREAGETVVMQVQTGFEKGTGEPTFEEREIDLSHMPFIVVIVDEMADLMMVAGKEIEGAIQRLAQMARAAGIHLIMATQRPSVDVITGTIKANFPTRISFQVTSKIDSRTILGEQGAEQLLGQGDMLHMAGGGRLARVHGPFVSDAEVEKVVAHLKTQAAPEYLETVTEDEDEIASDEPDAVEMTSVDSDDGDSLFAEAVKVVTRDKKCSTSYIQRRLGVGYNRAASLVERMEQEGLVGAPNHVGKREILVGK